MKQFLRPTLTAAALAVALGMTDGVHAQAAKSAAPASTTPPAVDKTKASYVVGWDLASSLPPLRTASTQQRSLSIKDSDSRGCTMRNSTPFQLQDSPARHCMAGIVSRSGSPDSIAIPGHAARIAAAPPA